MEVLKVDIQKYAADAARLAKEIAEHGDKPNLMDEERNFHAEDLSFMTLLKMKDTADAYLGNKVNDVDVTVPAYSIDSRRQTTKDAGAIAGFNVLRITNEPITTAIAYGFVDFGIQDFKRQNRGEGMARNHRVFRRLRTLCERAKCSLSSSTQVTNSYDDAKCENIKPQLERFVCPDVRDVIHLAVGRLLSRECQCHT